MVQQQLPKLKQLDGCDVVVPWHNQWLWKRPITIVSISLDSNDKHKSCTKSNQSLKVDANFGEDDLIDERSDTSIDNKEQPYKQK